MHEPLGTQSFYGHGKLLLTAEYLVLDGALALAVPTKYGQQLQVKASKSDTPAIFWKSIDYENQVWLSVHFDEALEVIETSDESLALRLQKLVRAALNMSITVSLDRHYEVTTCLEFPREWGLGSSSTLVYTLSAWFGIDPFLLQAEVLGGSGYDIACAGKEEPVLYRLVSGIPQFRSVKFNPPFADELFFVYLGTKQNSQKEVQRYRDRGASITHALQEIDAITQLLIDTDEIAVFAGQLQKHEALLADVLHQQPIQQRLFSDFPGVVKSLGAWGGDFVLATGKTDAQDYFRTKGYDVIVPYRDMVLG
jgi:mevalonate kinase